MEKIYKQIPVGQAKDLTNQRFGKLTVLYRVEYSKKGSYWLCQCECGNKTVVSASHLISNHTTSCGCQKRLKLLKDLTGKKFGMLTVLGYDRTEGKGHTYWKCQCDCGTIKSIRKDGLVSGAVISCGCYNHKKIGELTTIDLTGQTFGRWTVLKRSGSNQHNTAMWLCQCSCGNQKIVLGTTLRKGQSKSCGCLQSAGQEKIISLLKEHNIQYICEKTFENCKFQDTNHKAKFDFYIDNSYLIEFDGIQHYQSGTGWNTLEKFEKTKEHDAFKNQWCKENNIPLIRIPYFHLDKLSINDLKLDTTTFRIC